DGREGSGPLSGHGREDGGHHGRRAPYPRAGARGEVALLEQVDRKVARAHGRKIAGIGDRLVLQALHLRGPRNGPRTPPSGGQPFTPAWRARSCTSTWTPFTRPSSSGTAPSCAGAR